MGTAEEVPVDYGAIIKRAWNITWRYKILWVLGLFAGGTSGGYGGSGSNYRMNSQDLALSRYVDTSTLYARLVESLPLIIAAIVLLFLFALVWAVISIAAQGGLVQQVNEAAEDRPVRLGAGWSAGFHYWGRLAIAGLILLLPLFLLALLAAFATAVTVLIPLLAGRSPGAGEWAGLAFFLILLVPISIVGGFLLSNLYALASRYIVLEDRHAGDSISAAWGLLRHRFKDVFLVWLITVGLGVAFGFAIAVPAVFFGISMGITVMLGVWPVAVLIGLVLAIALVTFGAAFSTFSSAIWTIFFRRLTGREPARGTAAGQPTQPAYPGTAYTEPAYPGAHPVAYPPTPPAVYPAPPPQPPAPPSEPPPSAAGAPPPTPPVPEA